MRPLTVLCNNANLLLLLLQDKTFLGDIPIMGLHHRLKARENQLASTFP